MGSKNNIKNTITSKFKDKMWEDQELEGKRMEDARHPIRRVSLPPLVLKLGGNSIFDIIFSSHTKLLLNSPMVEPGLGILMPPAVEAKVRVLTTVRSNFREPF